MKLNKSLLIMALSFFAVSGLMAKEQSKKDEVPGVAAQPASYFYTGKPYDADLGAYTFNFRNYDPELKRWTSVDPSGFPDGANNYKYLNSPINSLDYQGLFSITYSTIRNGEQTATGDYSYSFDSKGHLDQAKNKLINQYLSLTTERDNSGDQLATYTYSLYLYDKSSIGNAVSGQPGWKYDEVWIIAEVQVTKSVNGTTTSWFVAADGGVKKTGAYYE